MKVATWNINGIRARAAEVETWLADERPDVLCLQELRATSAQIPASLLESVAQGYTAYWHGGIKGYAGVALLVRADPNDPPVFFHPAFDQESRIVAARLAHYTVASVYVPNGGKSLEAKLTFMEGMRLWAEELRASGQELLIAGDLNVAHTDQDVHLRERRPGVVGQRPDERALFDRILATGLSDVARQLAPNDDGLFTWWAPWRNMRARNIGWRIDYLLASSTLATRARSAVSQREFGTSDHAPLVIELA